MNELSEIFKAANNGDCITLENKIYEIAPEDSFHIKGLFSATRQNTKKTPTEKDSALFTLTEKAILPLTVTAQK